MSELTEVEIDKYRWRYIMRNEIRKHIDILNEGISEVNYTEAGFPYPLDRVLHKLMNISDELVELKNNAEGNLKNKIDSFHKSVHKLFKEINTYQNELKQTRH